MRTAGPRSASVRRPEFEAPESVKEHQLYLTDRAAWARLVAPRWRAMLADERDPERKRKLWDCAGDELKAELRRLASEERAA